MQLEILGTCKTHLTSFSYNDMARPRPLPRPRPRALPRPLPPPRPRPLGSSASCSSTCVSSNKGPSFSELSGGGWLGGEIIKPASSRATVRDGGVELDWGILCRILAAMFTLMPAMLYELQIPDNLQSSYWSIKSWKPKNLHHKKQSLIPDHASCFLRPWLKLNKEQLVKLSYCQFVVCQCLSVALQVSLTHSLAAPSHIWIHFQKQFCRLSSKTMTHKKHKTKSFASSRCLQIVGSYKICIRDHFSQRSVQLRKRWVSLPQTGTQ